MQSELTLLMFKRIILLSIFLSATTFIAKADSEPRLIIHLLDYLATDYSRAVENGVVVNEFEYTEMQEFAISINSLLLEVNDNDGSLKKLGDSLQALVLQKESPKTIAAQANLVKQSLVKITGISMAPTKWPSISKGKELYSANCLSCHGSEGMGNGPSALGLEPSPTNFTDYAHMSQKSPLQAYHTIRFGVEGTSMQPFHQLSDDDVWNLAFYISSLRYKQEEKEPSNTLNFETLATKTDLEIAKEFGTNNAELAYWRHFENKNTESKNHLDYATNMLIEAQALALAAKPKEARSASLKAYLEGIEPVEVSLKAQDPRLVQRIELEIGALRKLYTETPDENKIKSQTAKLIASINEGKTIMLAKKSSFWLTFSLAASVILREGLEAFLVIIIIISVLRKAGASAGIKYVHGGWILAVTTGVIGWFFTDKLLNISGMQRELLEGVIALVAVAILFYIGFWMHSKSEAQKWNEYVKTKIQALLNKQSMWGLSALAFLVVFREAFESVLFLSAISLEEGGEFKGAIGLGVLVAFAVVGVLAVIMLRFSKRIPIAQLFKFSALIIALLSIVLVGKGVHAIQESGYIGITAFPLNIRMGLLGIYPTVQTIMSQLFMLVLTIAVWKLQNRKKPALA